MISETISNDIPPQMKILNMVIPILMHSAVSSRMEHMIIKPHKVARHPTICEVINSNSIWQDIVAIF